MKFATRLNYAGLWGVTLFSLIRFYEIAHTPYFEGGEPDWFSLIFVVPFFVGGYVLLSAIIKWIVTGKFSVSLKFQR